MTINTDLMRQEEARGNIRIPFYQNELKATIIDITGKNKAEGSVIDTSIKGAAILLNTNDISNYKYKNMGIYVTLTRTRNNEKVLEDHPARIVWFKPESINGSSLLGIELLSPMNKQIQDINSPSFRQAVREKIRFNKEKKGESLYKYLDRVLHFMNNFINSDIGMIGYVVQEKNKKVITVEDTVFVGHRVDEFKDRIRRYEKLPLSELNLEETNYDENQQQEYSCMAYSQISERIYFIRYKEDRNDYETDNIMDEEDKKAVVQGKFNRIDEKIQAEITVPIKPWHRHNYDKSNREIVKGIFDILQRGEVDVEASLKILNFPDERDRIGELKDKDFVVVNDLTDEDIPRVLFRNPVSNSPLSINWDALKNIAHNDEQKRIWESIIDDIRRKSCDENNVRSEDIKKNEVIALLNFELIKIEHGFDKEITRKILQIIREEVEIEISGAMFEHYNFSRMLFYHALSNYLMGEPYHAYNELGRWREVQCRNMFRNFMPLHIIFNGYREFLKQEVEFFNTDPPEISDESTYNLMLNLTEQDKTPDTNEDGHGGIGLFHTKTSEEHPSELLSAIQRCYIPVVQLHFILEDIRLDELDSNEIEIYLKRARNIAIQIKRNIEPCKNGIERSNDASLTDYIDNFLEKLIKDKDEEIVEYLRKENAFNRADVAIVVNSFQQNFYDHYYLVDKKVEKKKKRMKYILDYFLHMRFLIGIAQLRHIIRRRKPSEMTFSDFEIVDKNHREFILRFIETCSMLILSESVKSEIKGKGKPEEERSITVPLAIAYLYRAKAFLLLGENQRAYNDFIRLERLAETRAGNFLMVPDCSSNPSPKPCFWLPKEKAMIFENWLKVLLNYHKGRVYFASFAKSQALAALCQSMEKLSESDKTCGKIPRIPRIITIDSMFFKGKAFFERGSYSRSLKWYLKTVYEIVKYTDRWWKEKNEPKQVWTPLQCALIEDLISLMEEYKHNAFIRKDILAKRLVLSQDSKIWVSEYLFPSSEIEKGIFKPMGKILSDVLNRIGFLLFDLRIYSKDIGPGNEGIKNIKNELTIGEDGGTRIVDIALDWVEKALEIYPKNGFAKFNQLLIKEMHGRGKENKDEDFIEAFSNMGHFHRQFYPIILHWMKIWRDKKTKLLSSERVYNSLLHYQLMYIDDFIRKPAEIYTYLTRSKTIDSQNDTDNPLDGLYFLGRYSSWSPKLPRPRVFSIKGGGKFLVWKGKGILIDPGFDLLNNLYAEGFSLEDIDAVIITHDHHDHTDDFEAMWRLIKEHNEVIKHSDKEGRMIELTLFANLGFEQKCSRFLSSDPEKTYVKRIYPLSIDTVLSPEGFAFDIRVMPAKHKEDLTKEYPIGFILELKEKENPSQNNMEIPTLFKVGFTSDTRFHKDLTPYYDCDIVVAHISNATFRELKVKLGFEGLKIDKYNDFFNKIREATTQCDQTKADMISVLKWTFWYGRDKNWVDNLIANENICAEELPGVRDGDNTQISQFDLRLEGSKLICDDIAGHGKTILDEKEKELRKWAGEDNANRIDEFIETIKQRLYPGVLSGHLGASGIYKIWEDMKNKLTNNKEKLLILSEFREEMGSFRNKMAKLLNDEFKEAKKKGNIQGNIYCFTSDIGMAIHFVPSGSSKKRKSRVQCSVCRHDNDLYVPIIESGHSTISYPTATFHPPTDITEVCIKSEAEGIFYLCKEHDTGPKSLFIERMDRYNLFGSEGMPL